MSASTGPPAEAERLNGQVDVCSLGDVELILQRADTPVSLNEETAPHATVGPPLGRKGRFCQPHYTQTHRMRLFPEWILNQMKRFQKSGLLLEGKMHLSVLVETRVILTLVQLGAEVLHSFCQRVQFHLTLINTAISVSWQPAFKTIKRPLRQYLWIPIFCLVVKSWWSFSRQCNLN